MNTRRYPRVVTPGDIHGMVTVLREVEPKTRVNGTKVRVVLARCACGTEKRIRLDALVCGVTVSCGCFHRQNSAMVLSTARRTHGESRTNLYRIWQAMKGRCTRTSDKRWADYGGRGIKVCDAWMNSFETFKRDVGQRPEGMTLDRIKNERDYEPGNVRWATHTEQARNTRRNHLHTMNGETRCLAEWCEITGEPWTTVKKRVAAGRDPFVRLRPDRRPA